jgi:hypothetical protein
MDFLPDVGVGDGVWCYHRYLDAILSWRSQRYQPNGKVKRLLWEDGQVQDVLVQWYTAPQYTTDIVSIYTFKEEHTTIIGNKIWLIHMPEDYKDWPWAKQRKIRREGCLHRLLFS